MNQPLRVRLHRGRKGGSIGPHPSRAQPRAVQFVEGQAGSAAQECLLRVSDVNAFHQRVPEEQGPFELVELHQRVSQGQAPGASGRGKAQGMEDLAQDAVARQGRFEREIGGIDRTSMP